MQRTLRMKREILLLSSNSEFICWPINDSLDHLQADLFGPAESPYENGVFRLDVIIPERYPFEPPVVKFVTPIYHPNVDEGGRICHDIFKMPPKGAWKPSLNIQAVLLSVLLLLVEPNPDDALIAEIASEYKQSREIYIKKARDFTNKHARKISNFS